MCVDSYIDSFDINVSYGVVVVVVVGVVVVVVVVVVVDSINK